MTIDRDIKASREDMRAIATLLSDALAQSAKLCQNEFDLAKAELAEKARQVGGAIGLIAGGVVLVVPAVVMALFALSAALIAAGWMAPYAYLTSAFIAILLAGILLVVGISQLKAQNLIPRESIEQLQKDKEVAKGFAR